jgi:hypothetical protein
LGCCGAACEGWMKYWIIGITAVLTLIAAAPLHAANGLMP